MSYPDYVIAQLVEVGGQSCGTLEHRLQFQQGTNPPKYTAVPGEGDFQLAECEQATVGSSTTWELTIRYAGGGACRGVHEFRRTTAADDPTGDYCKLSSGSIDCTAGQASVVEE